MWAAWTSTTNHHDRSKYIYWSSKSISTPEADVVAALDFAYTALSLLKPVCCIVLSAILNRTSSLAPVFGRKLAISKVAITCDFWSNFCPPKQFPVVCNSGVWLESSLRVILNSLPLTNQKAGEIMSVLFEGSLVVPMVTFWSYHQSLSSFIQDTLSKLENLAIRVHGLPLAVTSQ